jgi:hypothetical protein
MHIAYAVMQVTSLRIDEIWLSYIQNVLSKRDYVTVERANWAGRKITRSSFWISIREKSVCLYL